MHNSIFQENYESLFMLIDMNSDKMQSRNGTTYQIPFYNFEVISDKKEDYLLTCRKMFTKGIEGEFNTLIDPTPLTNVSQFEANGCNYWKLWAKEDGSINVDYHNELHPQFETMLNNMVLFPESRRHVIDLWNWKNVQNNVLSLPCCWYSHIYTIQDGKVYLNWIQRSVDVAIGLPSDVYLAYLFVKYVADYLGLKIGGVMFSLSNVHIYEEHLETLRDCVYEYRPDTVVKFKLKE